MKKTKFNIINMEEPILNKMLENDINLKNQVDIEVEKLKRENELYNIRINIANELKELRKKEHLTQKELAKKIGIKEKRISLIENAKSDLTLTILSNIANVFNKKLKVDLK